MKYFINIPRSGGDSKQLEKFGVDTTTFWFKTKKEFIWAQEDRKAVLRALVETMLGTGFRQCLTDTCVFVRANSAGTVLAGMKFRKTGVNILNL